MATINSVQYDNIFVKKYLADARDYRGKVMALPFDHTTVSDLNGDTVNLTVIPAGSKVVDFYIIFGGFGTSVVLSIGDAGLISRYMVGTSVASAGRVSGLAQTGQNYEPTSDTIVTATWSGANPTAGVSFNGVVWIIAAA